MLSIKTVSRITKRYRHLIRYQQIIGIILKYGFENIVDAMHIDYFIESGLRLIPFTKPHERVEKLSRNQRIRMMLEELGPTFVKMGQVLSSRPDLVPPDLTRELTRLQDKIPSFEFELVKQIIHSEFGKPFDEVFHSMEHTPFASASIGQVHRAMLDETTPIAVKIQRPGIRKIIEVDLEIIHYLAQVMENNIEEIAIFRPVKIVEEFASTLEKELDYTVEAANMERMAGQFEKDRTIRIPTVYRSCSGQRVLSMEFIEGIKADDIEAIDRAGLDRKRSPGPGPTLSCARCLSSAFSMPTPIPAIFSSSRILRSVWWILG